MIFNCARNKKDEFDMTKLSLLLSGVCRNGVSELHGETCRKMWAYAWAIPENRHYDTPIQHITNSVHVPYWQSPEIKALVEKAGGPDHVEKILDEELWAAHQFRKNKLINKIIERFSDRIFREVPPTQDICGIVRKLRQEAEEMLTVDTLIIGYARRFASYKRAGFFFEDEDLFFSFLEESFRKYGKPVAIVYAGKPHPSGLDGIAIIKQIHEVSERLRIYSQKRGFLAKLLFVDGYNIELARRLVAGVDIWLNNPIRPLEASGTSGMKAAINGVLNLSIPDGWVPEGVVNGRNGWLFGGGSAEDMREDREELYTLLREEILPAFFDRPDKLTYSPRWVQMMKNAIQDGMRQFNMTRMLKEYVEKMYLPAVRSKVSVHGPKAHH
jgi:starch phosphorylase